MAFNDARTHCPFCGSPGDVCENPSCGKVVTDMPQPEIEPIDKKVSPGREFEQRRAGLIRDKVRIEIERARIANWLASAPTKLNRRGLKARDKELVAEWNNLQRELTLLKLERVGL